MLWWVNDNIECQQHLIIQGPSSNGKASVERMLTWHFKYWQSDLHTCWTLFWCEDIPCFQTRDIRRGANIMNNRSQGPLSSTRALQEFLCLSNMQVSDYLKLEHILGYLHYIAIVQLNVMHIAVTGQSYLLLVLRTMYSCCTYLIN